MVLANHGYIGVTIDHTRFVLDQLAAMTTLMPSISRYPTAYAAHSTSTTSA